MRKLFTLMIAVFLTAALWAQSPEKMSYQAVIRDADNNLVTNQPTGMQISILQGSANGAAVYVETQSSTTNENGLVSIEIGAGTVVSGDFAAIDWANGPYFIKTETDPTGGAEYTITGVSQLLSVPYALHAKTAENVTGDISITEEDPVFAAWDKSTGISITESQISDLQSYIATELDPQFTGWDKSSGIVITESQISDLQTYLTSESDPAFAGWDKSTGISITESQISDLQNYLSAEVDPQFSSWDKATGIVITESQISDLQTYLTSESDPAFTGWDKSTGISITESQISDLQNYLSAEVDPQFTSWDKATGIVITESQISDLQTYLTSESDPAFTGWNKSTGISITESQISDLGTYLETETDPSVPTGTTTGEMQYWNGIAWVTVAATENEGATLQMIGGVPTWTGGTPPTPNVTNPTTGEIWMDRNLGASQVATSSTDASAYGDLYQWGRGADGHQIRASGTTATLATSDTPGHGDFITIGSSPFDWRSPQNDNLWQGVSGINNPCPSGYRLPTEAEWEAERASWSSNNAAGAFASPLKLPLAGYRGNSDGSLISVGTVGYYWSSTVSSTSSRRLGFVSSFASMHTGNRAIGYSVRCLKD
jgi:uncharacterized protein (TIGR02145 family)